MNCKAYSEKFKAQKELHHATVTMGLKGEENPWTTHAHCLNKDNMGNPEDDREDNKAIGFREIRSGPRITFPDKFSSYVKTTDSQKIHRLCIFPQKSYSKTY